jgi:hypothetical protein
MAQVTQGLLPNMGREDPCTSISLSSQAGDAARDMERPWRTEEDKSLGKLKGRVYLTPPGEREERILKEEILAEVSVLPISGSPPPWRTSLLFFFFPLLLFHVLLP